MDQLLSVLKQVFSGERLSDEVGAIGPPAVRTGGPEVLIGGFSPAALDRVGRWANGFLGTGPNVELVASLFGKAEESWKREGRTGKPRFVGAVYYALGPDALERGAPYLRDYYGFMGAAVEDRVRDMVATPEQVKELVQRFSDIGMDELHFWPCIPEMDQISRLEELTG